MYSILLDITGNRYGMLVAKRFVESKDGDALWEFLCDCGNLSIKRASNIKNATKKGRVQSCGCNTAAMSSESHKKHGMYYHSAGGVWRAMKGRCLNKNHKAWYNYGGRGITVCDRWIESFENFWADMGGTWEEGLWLDRIDNNGNYEPSNCRWATIKEQSRNKRNNHIISTPFGDMCITEAAELANIGKATLRKRISLGWSIEDLFKPVNPHKVYRDRVYAK